MWMYSCIPAFLQNMGYRTFTFKYSNAGRAPQSHVAHILYQWIFTASPNAILNFFKLNTVICMTKERSFNLFLTEILSLQGIPVRHLLCFSYSFVLPKVKMKLMIARDGVTFTRCVVVTKLLYHPLSQQNQKPSPTLKKFAVVKQGSLNFPGNTKGRRQTDPWLLPHKPMLSVVAMC